MDKTSIQQQTPFQRKVEQLKADDGVISADELLQLIGPGAEELKRQFKENLKGVSEVIGTSARNYGKLQVRNAKETSSRWFSKPVNLLKKITSNPRVRQAASIGLGVVASPYLAAAGMERVVRGAQQSARLDSTRFYGGGLEASRANIMRLQSQINTEKDPVKLQRLQDQLTTANKQFNLYEEKLRKTQSDFAQSSASKVFQPAQGLVRNMRGLGNQDPTNQDEILPIDDSNPPPILPVNNDETQTLQATQRIPISPESTPTAQPEISSVEESTLSNNLPDQQPQSDIKPDLPPLHEEVVNVANVEDNIVEQPKDNTENLKLTVDDYMTMMKQINSLNINIDINPEPIDGYAVTLTGEQLDVLKQNTQMKEFLRTVVTADRKMLEQNYPDLQSQENNYYQYGLGYSLTKSLGEALKVESNGRNIPVNVLLRSLMLDAGNDTGVIIDNIHNNLLKNFGWASKAESTNKRVIARYLYDIINTVDSNL